VVANFGPSTYPFPTLLLWTWAGLVGSPLTLPETAPAAEAERVGSPRLAPAPG
jgi:hypothetical protein